MGSRLDRTSSAVRRRIEKHKFENEDGDEYGASEFGGFGDYFRRKKIKLQNLDADLRASSSNNPQIFRSIVAHVNGYTQPSLNDLHHMIVSHGGGFLQYLDGKTMITHIIASTLTPKKKTEFRQYRIVKPAWVVDSINAGRLLPWSSYRVVDEGPSQKVLGFQQGRVVSQTNSQRSGYRDQSDVSWDKNQFKNVNDSQATGSSGQSLGDGFEDPPERDYTAVLEVADEGSNSISLEENISDIGGGDTRATISENALLYNRTPSPKQSRSQFSNANVDMPLDDPFMEDDSMEDLMTEYVPSPLLGPQADRQSPSVHNGAPFLPSKMPISAEEHNAKLLADPKVWKSTVANPGFLKQYYGESRLHHLSAWKADLKAQMQALAAERSPSQKTHPKRTASSRMYILHVDFDSFFAAVSLRTHPQYVDKPVVVAHGNGSGSEIASCNYPARKFGVKNGMWMKRAQELCPDLKVLPYDFKAYEEASRNFYEAILDVGGLVQSVSIDEALVDVTDLCLLAGGSGARGISEGSIYREQAKADEIAQSIRNIVKSRTGCAVSVGIGGNILLAKVALRKAKPAGQYQIKPEEVLDFTGELTVRDLPGVAYSIGGKMEEIGVKFVKDIRNLTKERLMNILGPKTGQRIWDYSRGIDHTQVGEQVVRKSVSAEVNWGIRFVTQEQADEFVQSLCDELHRRLAEQKVKGRQLTMKIMRRAADAPLDPPKHLGHGKCDVYNKSVVLGIATNAKEVLGREAISILKGFRFSPGELRGIGLQVTKLEALKGVSEGAPEGSQLRLQFKTPIRSRQNNNTTGTKPLSTKRPIWAELKGEKNEDPIIDEKLLILKTPAGPERHSQNNHDPIHDHGPLSSGKKSSPHPVVVTELSKSKSPEDDKPLNITGTQFILPTQADPKVIAELPPDIRSLLQPQRHRNSQSAISSRPATPFNVSRPKSPTIPSEFPPSESQLDKETLNALPEDMRAEILAYYQNHSPQKPDRQALFPQSPRKTPRKNQRVTTRKPPTLSKRQGGNLLFPRGKSSKKGGFATTTLTQSNFISRPENPEDTDKIDADFLAALPPDIREEVIAQQRLSRILKVPRPRLQKPKNGPSYPKRVVRLPPRPPPPTFTAQELSTLPELRDAVSKWVDEFREEAPFDDDVEALVKYLGRVVNEERDVEKAVNVVRWLRWCIEQQAEGEIEWWEDVMKKVENGVKEAGRERKIGEIVFD
ncbi:MAG: deoxycytidyl transferase [Cirrosporium novae-zelandiae]|nr:MAG: deoxycytidyl transferase [Cirrosporium novae-zelandiae]